MDILRGYPKVSSFEINATDETIVTENVPRTPFRRKAQSSYADYCGGDARQAVRELMRDADFLRDQLYTASRLMSQGYGRGWRPKYERLS